jgi:hypothetical protein
MAIVVVTAAFDGTQDTVAVTWSTAFLTAPSVTAGISVADSQVLDVGLTSITTTGCTVEPTARFVGSVELIASD